MTIKPNRPSIVGAYAVTLLLVFIPMIELVLRVWPLRFGDTSWRFGAVGLIGNAVVTPMLGIVLTGALAFMFGHRSMIRFLAVLCLVGGLLVLPTCGLFVLDALQMRGLATAEAKLAFDVATIQALMKLLIAAAITLLLGVGGWRSARVRGASIAAEEKRILVRPTAAV